MQLGIELSPTAAGRLDMEIAAADSVLGAAEKRLYLGAQTGAEAYLYKRAEALFPTARRVADDTTLVTHMPVPASNSLTVAPSTGLPS